MVEISVLVFCITDLVYVWCMLGVCFKGVHTPVYSLFFSTLPPNGVCVYVCFVFFCKKN